MKLTQIFTKKNEGAIAFTSIKPLSYKEELFEKNGKKLFSFLKIKPVKTAFARQVHGKRVIEVKNPKVKVLQEADGFTAYKPGYLLVVFTADCLPVFYYDLKKKYCAITHCDWKSIYKGITANAIGKLKKRSSKIKDIKVILGPRIRECCYEVGPEFAERFKKLIGSTGIYKRKGKYYFSLSDIVKLQLKKLGIPAKNVKDTRECTSCDKKRYFSYRRDGKGTGRMASGIMIRENYK